jgi:hypothetical protein
MLFVAGPAREESMTPEEKTDSGTDGRGIAYGTAALKIEL